METKVTTPQSKGPYHFTGIDHLWNHNIYFVDGMKHPELSYIQYVFFIAGIIWACINYSNQLNGDVTFGNLFAHDFKNSNGCCYSHHANLFSYCTQVFVSGYG